MLHASEKFGEKHSTTPPLTCRMRWEMAPCIYLYNGHFPPIFITHLLHLISYQSPLVGILHLLQYPMSNSQSTRRQQFVDGCIVKRPNPRLGLISNETKLTQLRPLDKPCSQQNEVSLWDRCFNDGNQRIYLFQQTGKWASSISSHSPSVESCRQSLEEQRDLLKVLELEYKWDPCATSPAYADLCKSLQGSLRGQMDWFDSSSKYHSGLSKSDIY